MKPFCKGSMNRGPSIFFIPLSILAFVFLVSLGSGQPAAEETRKESQVLEIQPQRIVVSGISINFVELGEGRPLLLLHGLGGSWKDWTANLRPFSSAYHVIAIDFPGFGDSDKPEVEYSIPWLTEIVEKFLRERKLERVYTVGHSMGALVAINLASRADSPVRKLVVMDAVGVGDKAGFLSYVLTKKIMGPNSRWESLEGALQDELKAMVSSFLQGQKPRTAREFFESVPKIPLTGKPLLPMTPAVQMSASIIDFDLQPKLPAIHQPTLILWGEKDPIAPPQDAVFLQNKIPQAILKMMENCGHSPMQEQPARFHGEVKKFLQAAESGSSR